MKYFRLYLRGQLIEMHIDIKAFSKLHAEAIAKRSHGHFRLVEAVEIKKPNEALQYEPV